MATAGTPTAEAAVPEALKYQTLALKVPLHCEGCKREVKRVLHHIEGVYKISFDAQQNKVVVTGNVAAEALVKKLNKAGKHAELWPEPKPVDNNPIGGDKKKKKKKKKKNKNKTNDGKPSEAPTPENPESNPASSGDEEDSSAEAPDKPDAEAPGHEVKEPAPGAEKPAPNAGGGGGGRRKGKNGRKVHMATEVEAAPQEAAKKPAAGGPWAPPAISFSTQLPTYVVSYSSAQPIVSQSGYHEATPLQQSRYVYSSASPGCYYIFSEENANACSVM